MPLTKTDLKAIDGLMKARVDASEERTKDRFNSLDRSIASVNEHLARIETKVDALLEGSAARKELRNLVSQLEAQGIAIKREKIFLDVE